MITALIADDEPVARRGLADLLGEFDWLAILGEAANGLAAAEMIDRLRPEVVFLDIEMPGMTGIELLAKVNHRPRLVFTTAYAQHAVTAFELGALDYLLKPFGRDRLRATLERLRRTIETRAPHEELTRYREVAGTSPLTRLFARTTTAVVPIAVDEVRYFEARGDYVAAHLENATHLLQVSLTALEGRLDPAGFSRIHRAYLVNLAHVITFRRAGKDRFVAVLAGAVELPVSRQRAQQLRRLTR